MTTDEDNLATETYETASLGLDTFETPERVLRFFPSDSSGYLNKQGLLNSLKGESRFNIEKVVPAEDTAPAQDYTIPLYIWVSRFIHTKKRIISKFF